MKPESEFAKKYGFSSPRECPRCHSEYDSAIQQNATDFQKAYERRSPQANRISFQGIVTEKSE